MLSNQNTLTMDSEIILSCNGCDSNEIVENICQDCGYSKIRKVKILESFDDPFLTESLQHVLDEDLQCVSAQMLNAMIQKLAREKSRRTPKHPVSIINEWTRENIKQRKVDYSVKNYIHKGNKFKTVTLTIIMDEYCESFTHSDTYDNPYASTKMFKKAVAEKALKESKLLNAF